MAYSIDTSYFVRAWTIWYPYPPPNIEKYISVADPVLILHAQLYHHVVVSNELSNREDKKGPKIPDLCELKGVLHATPAEFARTLGYRFGPV